MTNEKQIMMLNRFDAGTTSGLNEDVASLVARREACFGAASWLFYEKPIEMVRAKGVWMYDSSGKQYLDVYNNVPSIGHCHPHVVDAIARQAATLNTHTRYLYDNVHTYAERLLATFPDALSNIIFTCTGTESNDLALRLTSTFTGGSGFIVTQYAYHGNSAAVNDLSPSSMKSKKLAPHVRTVPAPDTYRQKADDAGNFFAESIRQAIADLEANGVKFAGLIVDTIFSSDGVYADPKGFLKPAVAAVHDAGGLFIADEVQPGFGRTGNMWGFQLHDVVPDIVTMGKPMGNGFPMGGVVTRPDILKPFCDETGYFNTFGGSPVAAAAGLAVLDVLENEGLAQNALTVGAYMRERLRDLSGKYPNIADVRGAGLFIGVEFTERDSDLPDRDAAVYAVNGLKEKGVLISASGSFGNSLKIRPPLCFSIENVDHFVTALNAVLQDAAVSRPT